MYLLRVTFVLVCYFFHLFYLLPELNYLMAIMVEVVCTKNNFHFRCYDFNGQQ